MKTLFRAMAIVLASTMLVIPSMADRNVIVNGERLSDDIVSQLEASYQTSIQPGRYWYDPASGLWGFERGPAAGQIAPGLGLGAAPRRIGRRDRSLFQRSRTTSTGRGVSLSAQRCGDSGPLLDQCRRRRRFRKRAAVF